MVSLPKKSENFVNSTAIVSGFGWDEIKTIIDPISKRKKDVGKTHGNLKYAVVKIVETSNCKANVYPSLLCGQVKQHTPEVHEGVCTVKK